MAVEKRLLDFDPLTGMSVFTEFHADGSMTLQHSQDTTAIIEQNKIHINDDDHTKSGIKRDMWHYATIPNIVAMKWMHEDGLNIFKKEDRNRMFRKLNDPDYRYLKATSKRHDGNK